MNIKMYRAVPKLNFEEGKIYTAQTTRRTPSNVPYVVDNIWEWLRLLDYPSRRFAAYASPSIAFALDNASAGGYQRVDYVACEVVLNREDVKIAHLSVKDAKYHSDISKITRCVIESLGRDFSNLTVSDKVMHAPLFLPSVSKEELHAYFDSNAQSRSLAARLKEVSTFWADAKNEPQVESGGELFFEVSGGVSYQLIKVWA